MAFLDHKGGAEYPYSKDEVFNAILEAIPKIKGMKIAKKDQLGGHIIVKAGVSLRSWGENIPISVLEATQGRARIEIISTPKTGILGGGLLDLGKNRANIEKILAETSKILSKKPPVNPEVQYNSKDDITTRLQKLKALMDSDLITKEDFEKRKSEILSQI